MNTAIEALADHIIEEQDPRSSGGQKMSPLD
jgi:diacylglycerol kinase